MHVLRLQRVMLFNIVLSQDKQPKHIYAVCLTLWYNQYLKHASHHASRKHMIHAVHQFWTAGITLWLQIGPT